jgi:hypothetical protein
VGVALPPSSAGVFPPTRGGEAHPPHSEARTVLGPPPARTDGGELTYGELPLRPASRLSGRDAAPRARRETVYGWADMPEELLAKVLEVAGWQEGGLEFSRASATARLVCAGWKAVYDALVRRLVLRRDTTDEAMGMLVLRFPAVAIAGVQGRHLGRVDGRRAASSEQPACAHRAKPQLLQRHGPGAAGFAQPPFAHLPQARKGVRT